MQPRKIIRLSGTGDCSMWLIFIFCILLEKTPGDLFEVCAETEGEWEGTTIRNQIHQGECISSPGALKCVFVKSAVPVNPGDQNRKLLSSTALHGGCTGGEWEDFLQADPIHWETEQRGEGADQSPGQSSRQSGWGGAGEDTEGDGRAQEDRRWAGEALSHWRPHPLSSGVKLKFELKMWERLTFVFNLTTSLSYKGNIQSFLIYFADLGPERGFINTQSAQFSVHLPLLALDGEGNPNQAEDSEVISHFTKV